MIDAALAYAADGFAVLPLHSIIERGGCSCGRRCGSPGKHPRTRHGLADATADPGTIRGWWRRWPRANVGVRTGQPSGGLVVVDLDGGEGFGSWVRLVGDHKRDLPVTYWTRTGSGWHVWYRSAEPVPCSTGRLAASVDVRGEGGYIVAPPSVHHSGRCYEVGDASLPVASLPGWIAERLRSAPPRPRPRSVWPLAQGEVTGWGLARLDGASRAVASAQPGVRHGRLYWAARLAGALVAAEMVAADVAQSMLYEAADVCGLVADDGVGNVTLTIRQGIAKGGDL